MNRIRTTLYIATDIYKEIVKDAEKIGSPINAYIVGVLLDYLREKTLYHYLVIDANQVVIWDQNRMCLACVYVAKRPT